MQSRKFSILEAAVKEFIKTGLPVSSGLLYKKYDFGIKPASIRNEFNALAKEGYLEQPHTSGGRVPTKKGYQFLTEKTLRGLDALKKGLAIKKFVDQKVDSLIDDLSGQLRLLSVGYAPARQEIYKSGLEDLFEQLSFGGKNEILEIIKDFEMLDARVSDLARLLKGDSPQVFIGESPVTTSRRLSVVADLFKGEDGEFVLMAIGPTRMDYAKVLKKFKELKG